MTDSNIIQIWVYLSASPLLGLTVTLLAYLAGYQLYMRSNGNPVVNPVAIAILLTVGYLIVTDTKFETYFEGAQFIHFLLGPATVAFAVPLYQQIAKLKAIWIALLISVLTGVATGALISVAIARLLGASPETVLSLAPKSVTTPIAMAISEQLGGLPSLTAVLVV